MALCFLLEVKLMTNGYDNTFILLSSVLSRINMIIGFVPGCVQSKLEEACVDITSVLRKKGFEVKLSDTTNDWHLDTFKIYTILNNISRDLGTCILLNLNEASLEDAAINISSVIKTMASMDSEFDTYYRGECGRSRVLK